MTEEEVKYYANIPGDPLKGFPSYSLALAWLKKELTRIKGAYGNIYMLDPKYRGHIIYVHDRYLPHYRHIEQWYWSGIHNAPRIGWKYRRRQ